MKALLASFEAPQVSRDGQLVENLSLLTDAQFPPQNAQYPPQSCCTQEKIDECFAELPEGCLVRFYCYLGQCRCRYDCP